MTKTIKESTLKVIWGDYVEYCDSPAETALRYHDIVVEATDFLDFDDRDGLDGTHLLALMEIAKAKRGGDGDFAHFLEIYRATKAFPEVIG